MGAPEKCDFIDRKKIKSHLDLISLVTPEGVAPPTYSLGNRCSICLSYGVTFKLGFDPFRPRIQNSVS